MKSPGRFGRQPNVLMREAPEKERSLMKYSLICARWLLPSRLRRATSLPEGGSDSKILLRNSIAVF